MFHRYLDARRGLTVVLFALALVPNAATAQFPSSTIAIAVPFSPGSGTDTGTRVLAEALREQLGQAVIVDNRPGANGAIAATMVASAEPDGSTLLMGTNSTMSANPHLIQNLGYDPKADFVPIGMVGTFEGLLAVNPERLPVKTAEELVAYIREHPGEVSYATGNVTGLVMSAIFARDLDLDLLQVPYKSTPEALTAVVSGEVDMMFPDIASSLPYTSTGALKPLASVTLGEPTPLAPGLVPISSTLAPDLKLVGWIGLFAPAGTPADIVDTLTTSLKTAVDAPAFRERFATLGINVNYLAPAELAAYVDDESASFKAIFDEIGMQKQ